MIDLHAIKIYVDFDKLNLSKKVFKKRQDGLIEVHDNCFKSVIIRTDEFFVRIYFDSYYLKKDKIPWKIIKEFQTFFIKTPGKFLRRFCEKSQRFNFELGSHQVKMYQTEQEEMFKEKYTNWPYFQFDFSLNSLFSIKEYHDHLNEKYDLYRICDRDWEEVRIFFKDFTVDNILKEFLLIKELLIRNEEISNEMKNARDIFFKSNQSQWFQRLKEIISPKLPNT